MKRTENVGERRPKDKGTTYKSIKGTLQQKKAEYEPIETGQQVRRSEAQGETDLTGRKTNKSSGQEVPGRDLVVEIFRTELRRPEWLDGQETHTDIERGQHCLSKRKLIYN